MNQHHQIGGIEVIQREGRVTLHDVAAAAGVSKSTVSRILDERLPRSESETAKRVREAALELGYIRDNSAASLRRGKTMTLGVIVPRLTDTVMAMLYERLLGRQPGHINSRLLPPLRTSRNRYGSLRTACSIEAWTD
jgi:DNA-binding LacI/PurR family transcriptional regulator